MTLDRRRLLLSGVAAVGAAFVGKAPAIAKSDDRVLRAIPISNLAGVDPLQPPFDNVKTRQAVLAAVDQTAYMTAMIGDPSRFQTCKDFFFCGTPLASGAGSGAMAASLQRGKDLLAASGYKGEKVVILTPSDLPWLHPAALVTEDLLKKLGMTVEVQAMDLGTFSEPATPPEFQVELR